MTSKVFFADLRSRRSEDSSENKVRRLFDAAGLPEVLRNGDLTAVKLHFGERGCTAFIDPLYIRQVVEKVKEAGARPFLTDTNTLYKGSRHDSVDHLENAIDHGFDYSTVRAPIIIADGLKSKYVQMVEVKGKHFSKVRIAGDIFHADSMIVCSHFKGHEMSGFGGALKNMAMGGATAYGKMDQHSVRPEVLADRCIGCLTCIRYCPVNAHKAEGGKVRIDKDLCIGCGECITVCPQGAIGLDWPSDVPVFIEKMVEYAFGVMKGKEGRTGFLNFVTKVSPDCDCCGWSDHPIVPDVGFLSSKDPVALDKASLDLVNAQPGFKGSKLKKNHEPGGDKFVGVRPHVQGVMQLEYAEELGLGSMDYELVRI